MTTPYPERWAQLDVTLAHDWLTGMRGGERVLEILCNGFPQAPILTLLHAKGSVSRTIASHPIRTSCLQHAPAIRKHYRYYLPLFPLAVNTMGRPDGDLLLSTSHCVAKSVRTQPQTRHLSYCFTPMRYAWLFHREYLAHPAKRLLAAPLLAALRRWDRRTARRVDRFVAISRHVQDRITRFYGRESDVVYPPVDTDFFTCSTAPREDFDLVVSAMVPYKRVDLAIDAYNATGRALRIVGLGTESPALQARAGTHIDFLGWQSDEAIRDLYRRARMLIFPGEEDFGIVPLEAQACGCPVVAFRKGGALETVVDGQSGVFFDRQEPAALTAAIEACAATDWNREAIRSHAERFGIPHFVSGMADSIDRCLGRPS